MPQIPQYLTKLLRRKRDRALFDQHPKFCRSIFSSFRFLIENHGFKLSEIDKARHELWIKFAKTIPVPVRNPICYDTLITVTIETEAFNDTFGNVSLWANQQSLAPLRSFDFAQIYRDYKQSTFIASEADLSLKEQLNQVDQTAKLMQNNWREIEDRLTRRIPRSRLLTD